MFDFGILVGRNIADKHVRKSQDKELVDNLNLIKQGPLKRLVRHSIRNEVKGTDNGNRNLRQGCFRCHCDHGADQKSPEQEEEEVESLAFFFQAQVFYQSSRFFYYL